MSFDNVVEITSVFPSPLGGSVFKALPPKGRVMSFRAAMWIINRTPSAGEYWRIQGDELRTAKYGTVIIVKNAYLNAMPSFKYIERLLNNHPAFRGFHFGKKKIKNLINNTGDYTLVDLLNKENYLAIADSGLNESIAKRLCEEWSKLKEETDVATFLSEHKLSSELARKVVRLCKFNTVERLKRNPYALLALSNSQRKTFKNIADVSIKLGILANDDRALVGCVEFTLYQELDKGHTIISIDDAKDKISHNLKHIKSSCNADEAIAEALKIKAICVLAEANDKYIQLISVAYIEQYVEQKLVALSSLDIELTLFEQRQFKLSNRIHQYNGELERSCGYKLTNEQCDAVFMALTNRVSVLTGFGGTGKTTVLSAIVNLAEEQAIPVHVAALAGKAANRARQSINRTTYTIHSLINNIKKGKIKIDNNPLVIIDESSMVDISLICNLLMKFEGKPLRLLFLGDTAQLPPIGFGLFFHKLVETNVPQVKLTKVHRQVADSPLHKTAMKIRAGELHDLPTYEGQESGVYLMNIESNYTQTILQLKKKIDCMVLTTYSNRKYYTSTNYLNPLVQSLLNSPEPEPLVMTYGVTTIKPHDPVLATKNNYTLGIFNGMTGTVEEIIKIDDQHYCDIRFEDCDDLFRLSREQCWEMGLQLAYLITIHKSQGSEYNNGVILLESPMLERSALYTALTRTKKLCVIVGTIHQYNAAIAKEPSYKLINCGFNPSF